MVRSVHSNRPNAMKRLTLTLLAAAALSACTSEKPTVSDVDTRQSELSLTQVTATRVAEGVRVTNGTGVEIRFLVKNAGWLGLLAGCHNEPSSCTALAAGQSVVVKSADIYGNDAGTTTLEVWYWAKGSDDPAGKSIHVE